MLRARTIVLACGVSWRQLPHDGFERLAGRGVFYGASRSEAASTHGEDVHIVGAGNSAGPGGAVLLHARAQRDDPLPRRLARQEHVALPRRPGRARENVAVRFGAEVVGVHGEASLEAIDVRDRASGDVSRLDSAGLFIFIGADAETGWLPEDIALDARGFVLTGADVEPSGRWSLDRDPYLLETSVPGVFACGDVRYSPVKRVAAAVGEGSMAIAFVHQYLREAVSATGAPRSCRPRSRVDPLPAAQPRLAVGELRTPSGGGRVGGMTDLRHTVTTGNAADRGRTSTSSCPAARHRPPARRSA